MPECVFHLDPVGRLANLMIEYMVALKFRDITGGSVISNIRIPEWGIEHPAIPSPGPLARESREQHIDLAGLAEQVRSGQIKRVEWRGFGQRMENFLPPERYRSVFAPQRGRGLGFGDGELVCPVRAEDILHGPNPEYVLTPVQFYRDLVRQTGLRPVFIGQTHPNAYLDSLRAAFPNAEFRAPQSDVLIDFETIRQSRHVALSVSTYAWLAAWLSEALQTIWMPVNGLYNPMQKPQVDLLPFGDARYRFILFPINYAVPLGRHAEVHRRIAPYWREMPHEALRQQITGAPRFARRIEDAMAVFDDRFYLEAHPDVAAVAARMGPEYGRFHYHDHGFHERRLPMRFDPVWYASEYPMAAFEVAQGDYAELVHHYVAIGRARGYRPVPPGGAAPSP